MQRIIDELRQTLPPVFAGTSLDQLTGGVIHWPTVQNRRALRQIPDECFARSGTRVLVLRDPFLNWWATTLKEARQPVIGNRRKTGLPRTGEAALAMPQPARPPPIDRSDKAARRTGRARNVDELGKVAGT